MGRKINSEKAGQALLRQEDQEAPGVERGLRYLVRLYALGQELGGDGEVHGKACQSEGILPLQMDGQLSGSAGFCGSAHGRAERASGRIAHQEFDFIVEHVCDTIGNLFRADPKCGNDQEFNKKIVVFDENMMSPDHERIPKPSHGMPGDPDCLHAFDCSPGWRPALH